MGSVEGDSEQYCLKWNDFESNITQALSDLRQEEALLDVTLVAVSDKDQREIRAHSLVLCACSPLFRKWLCRKNLGPNPTIFLHGIRFDDVKALLHFMYHGEVNVNQEDLQVISMTSASLEIWPFN